MARRLDEQERAKLVQRFLAECGHMNAAQLKQLRTEFNLRMANGRLPFADVQANYSALVALNKAIQSKEQQEAQRERSPDEAIRSEAAALARQHGVSVPVAERHLRENAARQARKPDAADSFPFDAFEPSERDPLNVARKHRKPAPPPCEPEPKPTKHIERPDLRPRRLHNNNEHGND